MIKDFEVGSVYHAQKVGIHGMLKINSIATLLSVRESKSYNRKKEFLILKWFVNDRISSERIPKKFLDSYTERLNKIC